MIYKYINGLAPTYLAATFFKRSENHSYNTRNKDPLSLLMGRTTTAQVAPIIGHLKLGIILLLQLRTRTQFRISRIEREVKRSEKMHLDLSPNV